MLDIKKYDAFRFSDDEELNKKIKALYLLLDNYIDENKLTHKEIVRTINFWIRIFVDKEEYELAEAFKKRKIVEWKKIRKIKRYFSAKLFYRFWKFKLKKFLK